MHRHSISISTSAQPKRHDTQGFTLIEVMIVVAIVAILVAVALPSYRDYILRGQLTDATNLLSSMQANMERYFQDNRTYRDVSATIVAPCDDPSAAATAARTLHSFTLTCATNAPPLAEGYLLTVTGSGSTLNFIYTVDQVGNQITTSVGGGWPTVSSAPCWIVKKGQTCS